MSQEQGTHSTFLKLSMTSMLNLDYVLSLLLRSPGLLQHMDKNEHCMEFINTCTAYLYRYALVLYSCNNWERLIDGQKEIPEFISFDIRFMIKIILYRRSGNKNAIFSLSNIDLSWYFRK